MEPKLKEAILKMRKLDRILQRKMEKEKKVKQERIELEKRYAPFHNGFRFLS